MGSQDIVNDEGVCEDVGGGHQQQARVEGYHDTGELDPPLSDEVWDNNVNGGVDQFEGDERVERHKKSVIMTVGEQEDILRIVEEDAMVVRVEPDILGVVVKTDILEVGVETDILGKVEEPDILGVVVVILLVVVDILGMLGEMTLTIVGEVVMMKRMRREEKVLCLGVMVIQVEAVGILGEGEADMDAGDIVISAIDFDILCYGVMRR